MVVGVYVPVPVKSQPAETILPVPGGTCALAENRTRWPALTVIRSPPRTVRSTTGWIPRRWAALLGTMT